MHLVGFTIEIIYRVFVTRSAAQICTIEWRLTEELDAAEPISITWQSLPAFYETCTQEPTTKIYPEPDEANLRLSWAGWSQSTSILSWMKPIHVYPEPDEANLRPLSFRWSLSNVWVFRMVLFFRLQTKIQYYEFLMSHATSISPICISWSS